MTSAGYVLKREVQMVQPECALSFFRWYKHLIIRTLWNSHPHLHICISLVRFAWSWTCVWCSSLSEQPLRCECWAQRTLWPWEFHCIGGILPGTCPVARGSSSVLTAGAVCSMWHPRSGAAARCQTGTLQCCAHSQWSSHHSAHFLELVTQSLIAKKVQVNVGSKWIFREQ